LKIFIARSTHLHVPKQYLRLILLPLTNILGITLMGIEGIPPTPEISTEIQFTHNRVLQSASTAFNEIANNHSQTYLVGGNIGGWYQPLPSMHRGIYRYPSSPETGERLCRFSPMKWEIAFVIILTCPTKNNSGGDDKPSESNRPGQDGVFRV